MEMIEFPDQAVVSSKMKILSKWKWVLGCNSEFNQVGLFGLSVHVINKYWLYLELQFFGLRAVP